MALAVEHEGLGHLVVLFGHECHLHLILDVLHAHAVAETQTLHDAVDAVGIDVLALRSEGLDQRALDLFSREALGGAVALGNHEIVGAHRSVIGGKKCSLTAFTRGAGGAFRKAQ